MMALLWKGSNPACVVFLNAYDDEGNLIFLRGRKAATT